MSGRDIARLHHTPGEEEAQPGGGLLSGEAFREGVRASLLLLRAEESEGHRLSEGCLPRR